jgi:small nuclear ribonucleoprotein (snRNP)-like protein
MNVVMDEAVEVYVKYTKPRRELGKSSVDFCQYTLMSLTRTGRILLKGDNITLIQQMA